MRAFRLPPELAATEPPEARGIGRDEVRLLVAAHREQLRHTTFAELPSALVPGDLVVVNTSDTEPAAVDGRRAGGRPVVVHVSGPASRRYPGEEHPRQDRPADRRRARHAAAGPGRAADRLGAATRRAAGAADPHDPDTRNTHAYGAYAHRVYAHGVRAGEACPGRGHTPAAYTSAYADRGYAGEAYLIELRTPDGQRVEDATAGELIQLPGGATAVLSEAYPDPALRSGSRLWLARIPVEGTVQGWLAAVGRPIRYAYLRGDPPLSAFRTIFATPSAEFGSAEMPSAGRPFTRAVLDGLRGRGIGLAEIVLHTGVSSLEAGEMPLPERFRVPAAAADAVNTTHAAGGRVVAVGTTVTRALETVAAVDGTVRSGAGWTDLVLGPGRPARVVDGLVTGWHEPGASHLLLLAAVAGRRLVERAYAAAIEQGYLWHEFGDSCLLLPRPRTHGCRRALPSAPEG